MRSVFERLGWAADVLEAGPVGPTFAVDETAIDPAVFGLTSYASPTAPAPRIDRKSAIQVPAVKRSRDLVCGTLGTLPVQQLDAAGTLVPSEFLEQPERNRPRSVTFTELFEDLFFEKIAWWKITETGPDTFPLHVERKEPRAVEVADKRDTSCSVRDCSGKVRIDGKHVHDAEVIRFDSPNDALLVAGARAIRICLSLDAATTRYADEPTPTGWFTPADPDVEPSQEELPEILDGWAAARRTRTTAYVPGSLSYNTAQFTPVQLELAEQRRHAVLEIARLAGVDAEELSVAVTSRTYNTEFGRRKQFVDFTLGQFRAAVQDRLSMGDVTAPGRKVRFSFDEFLQSDPAAMYAAIAAGLDVGAIFPDEVRPLVGKAPAPAGAHPPLRALPAPPAQEATR